jgi:uncharacterized membrane protein
MPCGTVQRVDEDFCLTTVYVGIFPDCVLSPRPLHKSLPDSPGFARSGWGVKRLLSQTGFYPKGATMPENTPQTGLSDNAAGALAYFTFIPALIFLLVAPYNQKASIRFHAWQSILLFVAAVIIDIVLGIVLGVTMIFLGFTIYMLIWRLIELCWFAIWLVCVFNAFNGKRFKLPVIGDLAEKQAGN